VLKSLGTRDVRVSNSQDGDAFQAAGGKGSITPKKGQSAQNVGSDSESDQEDPIAKFIAAHGKEQCHSSPLADAEFAKLIDALKASPCFAGLA
jgi:hypothetical protein